MPSKARPSTKLTLVSGRVFNNLHTKNQFIDHKGMKQIQISKTFDTFLQSPLVSAKQTKEKAPIAIYYNIYYNHTHACYFILHEASKRECSIKYKHTHKERENINIYIIYK